MAAPWMKNSSPSSQIGDVVLSSTYPASAAAMTNMPTGPTTFGPYRRTSAALRGDNSSCPTANGTVSRPASSAL